MRRLAQGAIGPIYFHRMADGDPDEAVAAASVQVDGTTTITTQGGAAHHVQVVTVRADGAVANSHWVAAGEVLGSDWNGATSWLVDGPEEALEGLPQFMVAFLRAGYSAST